MQAEGAMPYRLLVGTAGMGGSGAQTGDNERCPAGHEPSSSVVLPAPPCAGAQVLYTPVERREAEYLALLEGEDLCRFSGERIALVPLHAIARRKATSDKAAAVANASEIAKALGDANRSGTWWRRFGVAPKALAAGGTA
jgi:hypothetical protein